jgi:hypothetical protein
MTQLALLLKSYAPDRAYAERLVTSFRRFNADGLTLYCVVPDADLELFQPLAGPEVEVMPESLLAHHLVDRPVHGLRPGYINQEIVKLSFWELGLSENTFCVDSEAVFIRPFGVGDFMADERTPYTVLVEDRELLVEPRYYREHWVARESSLRRIQELIGATDPVLRTCHGHQVFSSPVLRSFRDDFLRPRGWGYADALEQSPYEFSWYSLWLQHSMVIPIRAREPLVKVFHHEGQHLEYILRGITIDDMARAYIAVVVNSNYSRDLGLVSLDESKPDSLARYLSYGELAQLTRAKMGDTLRRRLRRT